MWSSLGIGHYPNFHDPGGSWWQGEPALHFFRRAIFSGQLPFWDPSAASGIPAYTNLQTQFLFPSQIALSLLGPTSTGKNIYILLLFWASGFTTNYGFRAIAIPAGDVWVKLSYLPVGFMTGGVISLFGVACAIALALRKPVTP